MAPAPQTLRDAGPQRGEVLFRIRTIASYSAIYLIWGCAYLPMRILAERFAPLFIAGVRYLLAALLLLPLLWIFRAAKPSRTELLNAMWTGALLLAISFGIVFWASARLPSWLIGVLMSTTFAWTYLGESVLLRARRVSAHTLILPVAATVAVMLLLAPGRETRPVSIGAGCAVLFSAIMWSAGSLATKRFRMPASPIATATVQLGTSGALLLMAYWLTGKAGAVPSFSAWLEPRVMASLGFLAVGASVLTMVAFHWLLAHEPASMVATSSYVNPVVAMLVGVAAGSETITALQMGGAALLLGCVVEIWRMQKTRAPAISAALRSS